jgi:glycerol-3-phosphate dehydrogenase
VGQFSGIRPPEVIHEVVRHCCREEWAEHLDDLMLRRTGWHYYYKQSDQIAQQAAAWMAEEKGWDEPRRQEELERYRRLTA